MKLKKIYKGSTNQNFLEGKASLIASYPNLAKERKESCLSTKKLKVDITKDTTEIQRIIRNYCENLYSNKSEKGYIPRKWITKTECRRYKNAEHTKNKQWNRGSLKTLLTKQSEDTDCITAEFCKNIKKELMTILHRLSPHTGKVKGRNTDEFICWS